MITSNIQGIPIEEASPEFWEGLRIRVSDWAGEIFGKLVEVRGTWPEQSYWSDVRFVTSLFDCTDDQLLPVQCLVGKFQERSTSAYRMEKHFETIRPGSRISEWTPIGIVDKGILRGPFAGPRVLLAVVRLATSHIEMEHGRVNPQAEVIWTGKQKFDFELGGKGYVKSQSKRRNFHVLSVHFAALIAVADGTLDEAEIQLINDKMRNWLTKAESVYAIYDGQSSSERMKKYEEIVTEAICKAKAGKLNEANLLSELREGNNDRALMVELIELCYDVMAVDGRADPGEMRLIEKIAKEGKIDPARLAEMQQKISEKLDTGSSSDPV